MASQKPQRPRSSSIQQTLSYLKQPPAEHRLQEFDAQGDAPSPSPINDRPMVPPDSALAATKKPESWAHGSEGLWQDILTMRWMRLPTSSLKMIGIVLALWLSWSFLLPDIDNPFAAAVLISYPLPRKLSESRVYYTYGYRDVAFLAFYVIVFSFVRQASTEYIVAPIAKAGGIKKGGKMLRFMEQGYAVLYFSVFGALGVWVMSGLPTWWFRTEYFWTEYPNKMTPEIKIYYLLQFSYWLQQMLVLVLKIEKPRPDFVELCIHHAVTLWLVGWSYVSGQTFIGNCIFVTMDVSDVFLATAKCLNYLQYTRASEMVFVTFLGVWTYFRHYLNLVILHSVWYQFDTLVPPQYRYFEPKKGWWLAPWLKYQIFVPIALLQMVNLFWYYLIWRVVGRIVFPGKEFVDIREEGETDDEAQPTEKKKDQ